MGKQMPLSARTGMDLDFDARSLETGLECKDPSLAVQSAKEETDINVIVERFGVTGVAPQNIRPPTFEDYGDTVFDFRTAVEAVAMAQDTFMMLDAKIRARFENDPQLFLEFCTATTGEGEAMKFRNEAEMRQMGLLKPVTPAAAPVPPAPDKPA